MFAGSKFTFKFGHFSSSSVSRKRSAVSCPVSNATVTPLAFARSLTFAKVSRNGLRSGSFGSGMKPACSIMSLRPSAFVRSSAHLKRSSRSGRVAGSPKPPVFWMWAGVV